MAFLFDSSVRVDSVPDSKSFSCLMTIFPAKGLYKMIKW